MVHDSARQRVVLFGGQSGSNTMFDDTWLWDGTTWSSASPATSPPARTSTAMAYDSTRQRIVLFGGNSTAGPLSDLWEWDGLTWTAVVATGPAARHSHAMAFDSHRSRTVLFGGAGASTFADTWEWDGAFWTPRLSSTIPGTRSQHAMAYDPVRQRTVMCGGYASTGLSPDTWEWDGQDWQYRGPLVGTAGNGRAGHAIEGSPSLQRVVVHGGLTAVFSTIQLLTDTLTWNGQVWTPVLTTSTVPARLYHGIAFDSASATLVLFGGTVGPLGGLPGADTWTLGGTAATTAAFGTGCGMPPLALNADPAARPILGQVARARVPNPPSPVVAVTMGWSNHTVGPFTLPLPLSGFGLTGCSLWHSAELLGLPLSPLGAELELAIPIPATLSLLTRHVYLQAYAYAPGQNPAEVTTSNALDWRFGDV